LFKDAQTYVANGLYGSIAKARAEARSVQLSITKAALLDIAIVNGVRSGKDIFEDIVRGADTASFVVDSSAPGAKMKIDGKDVDEISWLNALLKKWEKVNPAAQPHVKVFRELISNGRHSFDSKQTLTVSVTSQLISYLSTGSTTENISKCEKGGPGEGYYAGYINFSTKYATAQHVINVYRDMNANNNQFSALLQAVNDYATTSTGIRYGLTKAALLDIAIVNGAGEGINSIGAIVNRTDAAAVPADNTISASKIRVNGKDVDEISWLQELLRKWLEANPGVQRHVGVFRELIAKGYYSFDSKEPVTATVISQLISQLSTGSTKSISRCRPGGDGKGYYAGYINFSTKYGSALEVINEFIKTDGGAQFSALLPTLKDYASNGNGAVAGLDGFCEAWKAVADAHPDAFLKAQTTVVDRMYGAVATRLARDRKIQYGLTKAALLDIAIVNGVGAGMNTIDNIVGSADDESVLQDKAISASKIRVKGKDVDEIHWLETLLKKWRDANPAVQPRVDLFQALLADGRYSFDLKESYTMGSEEEFKTTIAEYLESLPTQFCRRVFSSPAACLAIFRMLSTVGKQLVMSMLYLDSALRLQDVLQWAKIEQQRVVKGKIHQLRKLQL
ncbi:RNA polymerase II transcription factor B 52 kDa subunit, partial [Coemansia nantahalensis]